MTLSIARPSSPTSMSETLTPNIIARNMVVTEVVA